MTIRAGRLAALIAAVLAAASVAAPARADCPTLPALACGATVSGNTTRGAAATADWSCLAWDLAGPEETWVVTPAATTDLLVRVTPAAGFDVALVVLTGGCDPSADCVVARDRGAAGRAEGLRVAVTAGEPVYVVVDGYASGGAYTIEAACGVSSQEFDCADGLDDDGDTRIDCLDADCAARAECLPDEADCGDGVDNDGDGATDCDDLDCYLDPDCLRFETDCSDGVDEDADGATDCDDDDCAEYPECAPDVCTAAAVLGCGSSQQGSTVGVADGMGLYDCVPVAYIGGERVFAFSPAAAAVATVTVTPGELGFDVALFVLTGGCAPQRCTNLRDFFPGGFPETIEFLVRGGEDYFLVVDGYESAGTFGVSLTCRPPSTEVDCADGRDDDGDGPADCEDPDCAADRACAPCREEGFEPNGSPDAATRLPGAGEWPGLVIADREDQDWYALALCAGAWLTIDARFAHAAGDIDLTLLTAAGEPLASANSANDNERLELLATRGGTHYLVVSARDGRCTPYALAVAIDETGCAAREVDCGDGVDDDGDGATDCADPDCAGDPACGPRPPEADCDDGADDDGDGATDCADPDCAGDPACGPRPPEADCDDGADDDGDGATDCADPDCAGDPACGPPSSEADCDDGADDDGDGATDCADPDCAGDPACGPVEPAPDVAGPGADTASPPDAAPDVAVDAARPPDIREETAPAPDAVAREDVARGPDARPEEDTAAAEDDGGRRPPRGSGSGSSGCSAAPTGRAGLLPVVLSALLLLLPLLRRRRAGLPRR
jgi:hypothetical protein